VLDKTKSLHKKREGGRKGGPSGQNRSFFWRSNGLNVSGGEKKTAKRVRGGQKG